MEKYVELITNVINDKNTRYENMPIDIKKLIISKILTKH